MTWPKAPIGTPRQNNIAVWDAIENRHGQENLRLERAQAANTMLVQIGVPEPTPEQVAMLMRWADTYQLDAVTRVLATFDIPVEKF